MQRRQFLATTSAAITALASYRAAAATPAAASNPIFGFTKSFADLSLADSAAVVEEVGWDGVDIPIREKSTHIALDRMADELPAFIELMKKRGKTVGIVTSDVLKITPKEEKFVRTLAACGVKHYRLGFRNYQKNEDPMKVVREMVPVFRDIAALNEELGLWAGYQNHSGPNYFGGPIWDVITAMENTNPQHLGLCFDIAHATVEGGQNWPIQYRLARSRIGAAYIKDYRWREEKGTWHRDACAFGTGLVRKAYFDSLRQSQFAGPFCQHHEYPLGTGKDRIAHYRRDLEALRKFLAPA